MGDRLVWKRGRESQNDTGPSSSGKFETADKTSGHVSIQPDDFSRTMTHYCPFRENRKINKLRIVSTQIVFLDLTGKGLSQTVQTGIRFFAHKSF